MKHTEGHSSIDKITETVSNKENCGIVISFSEKTFGLQTFGGKRIGDIYEGISKRVSLMMTSPDCPKRVIDLFVHMLTNVCICAEMNTDCYIALKDALKEVQKVRNKTINDDLNKINDL